MSKPIPPKWSFADAEERTPVTVAGLAVVLLVALRIGRMLLTDQVAGRVRRRWFETAHGLRRWPLLSRTLAPAIAIVVTVALFLWPLVSAGSNLAYALLLVAGIITLVAVALRLRLAAAERSAISIEHYSWPPSILFGIVATGAGVGWAPLPVVKSSVRSPVLYWAGPLTLTGAAIVSLLLGVVLDVPFIRAVGASALVMASSLLTPIEPLDGAFLSKNWISLVVSLTLFTLGLLLLLGVI